VDVVDPDDRDVLGNAQPGVLDGFHGPERGLVTDGEDGRGPVSQGQQLLHLHIALARVSGSWRGPQLRVGRG